MTKGKKYVVVAPEVYEILFIKAGTLVNPIALTIKNPRKSQPYLESCWNFSRRNDLIHTEELNKLRTAKD